MKQFINFSQLDPSTYQSINPCMRFSNHTLLSVTIFFQRGVYFMVYRKYAQLQIHYSQNLLCISTPQRQATIALPPFQISAPFPILWIGDAPGPHIIKAAAVNKGGAVPATTQVGDVFIFDCLTWSLLTQSPTQ